MADYSEESGSRHATRISGTPRRSDPQASKEANRSTLNENLDHEGDAILLHDSTIDSEEDEELLEMKYDNKKYESGALPDDEVDLLCQADPNDTPINTPYGSPGYPDSIFDYSSDITQMLIDDQEEFSRSKNSENDVTDTEIEEINKTSTDYVTSMTRLSDIPDDAEATFTQNQPEDLAEYYSRQLIEKEQELLKTQTAISLLERSNVDLSISLDDTERKLKHSTMQMESSVEALQRRVDEKDLTINRNQQKISELSVLLKDNDDFWKVQEDRLEEKIHKLETELKSQRCSTQKNINKLTQASILEKENLEMLKKEKEESQRLRSQLTDQQTTLEAQLDTLRREKASLEEQLNSEIERLQNKIDSFESIVGSFQTAIEARNKENVTLLEDISQQNSKIKTLEDLVSEVQQNLQDKHLQQETEKHEYESKLQVLKEEMEKLQEESIEEAPVNFFRPDDDTQMENWLDTKKALEDRIAELEVEKGNLLLQLVDVDEHEQQDNKPGDIPSLDPDSILKKLGMLKQAFDESEQKVLNLEQELEESKIRDGQRIETAMNTIAWEEKFDNLQKENHCLAEELKTQRQAADDLSCRYEELETKYNELEMGRPPIEGIVAIDKCDGWSDEAPQLPDEGFTEDPQITELKLALDSKQQEIETIQLKQQNLEEELAESVKTVTKFEVAVAEIAAEKASCAQKVEEYMQEIEVLRQEIQNNKAAEQPEVQKPAVSRDGWGEDATSFFDEGFNDDHLTELQKTLSLKNEEITTAHEKCRTLEDKLKKALRALKQKNDKIAELKSRAGEEVLAVSTASLETSIVEPLQSKSVAFESSMSSPPPNPFQSHDQELQAQIQQLTATLEQKDVEIERFRNELSQLASTMNTKNEDIEQLMKTCGDMQKSLDEKVELLNHCVGKKDEEVRQAISQYEDCLKDATLNVSHLTQELEGKIRQINQLHGQVQEAQESLLETQNEFDCYKAEIENQFDPDAMEKKDQRIQQLRHVEEQLRQELIHLQTQFTQFSNEHTMLREALDRGEAEKKQMREDASCIHNEYGAKTSELQLKISSLMDQLNECEAAVSVMETRLKETDDKANEVRYQLEEKCKGHDAVEQALFVKTEDCVRLEEGVRLLEERHKADLEARLNALQEQHRMTLEAYELQNLSNFERSNDELGRKSSQVLLLTEQCRVYYDETVKLQEDYDAKCVELAQMAHTLSEAEAMKTNIQELQATLHSQTEQLNTAQSELSGKSSEVQTLQATIREYMEKINSDAVTLDNLKRTLQETENAATQYQVELETCRRELQNCQVGINEYRLKYEESQSSTNDLQEKLKTALDDVATYSFQAQTMSHQLANLQNVEANLNKYLEELNTATDELGKKNLEIRKVEASLKKTCSTQEAQIQNLKAEISSKDVTVLEREEHINILEQEIRKLDASRDSSSKYATELLAEIDERSKEISDLRFELDEGILQEKNLKKNLEDKDHEVQHLREEIRTKDIEIEELKAHVQATPVLSAADESLTYKVQYVESQSKMLEMKVNLLQNKLAEVEESELKCSEDFAKMKIARTELEMDNLRMSDELNQFQGYQDGRDIPKFKSMENQIVLMSKTLEDRDLVCQDLLTEIQEAQLARDSLIARLHQLESQQSPLELAATSWEANMLDRDSQIFSLKIDIRRERKMKELYKTQLLLVTSKRQFESPPKKSGSWFGLGDLFASPAPTSPPTSARRVAHSRTPSVSTSPSPSSSPNHGIPDPTFTSTPGRPITPISPTSAYTPSLFDSPTNQSQLFPPSQQLPHSLYEGNEQPSLSQSDT